MRRVVAAEYLSLDGVTEDPGPTGEYEHRGWTVPYWDDEIAKWQTDRVTYDEFVASWPLRSGDLFTDRMKQPAQSTSPRGHSKSRSSENGSIPSRRAAFAMGRPAFPTLLPRRLDGGLHHQRRSLAADECVPERRARVDDVAPGTNA
jgi:hypothetical protein